VKLMFTKKNILSATTAILLLTTPVLAESLTVVGFGGTLQDALRTSYFGPFSKSNSIEIKEDTYEGGISKIKAMVETKSVVWDVVQMDENEIALACNEGLLEPASAKDLGIADKLLPQAASSKCGVGFFVWSMVLSYDKTKFAAAPTSWADIWDTKKWPGKRGLRKQARMTLEIALLADGVAPADVYKVLGTKEGADRAFAKLDQIKSDVVWWESGAQAPERLASGDVVLTAAYNGRIATANANGKNFGMVWNNQLYGMDFWAVVKGSKVESAKSFVKFALDAPNQKAFTDAIPYGITNVYASALVEPKIAPQLPTSDSNIATALSLSTPFWVDHEEELQARFTQWLSK
jgi:putative spermidine/putrescine transport system substrate-binding protein